MLHHFFDNMCMYLGIAIAIIVVVSAVGGAAFEIGKSVGKTLKKD